MRALLVIAFAICLTELSAQQILSGMVADSATFEPLPFVTVRLKEQNKGTITDSQGNFKIVATEADTLIFQYLGYGTLELPAKGWDANLVLLSEKATMLKTITIRDSVSQDYHDLFREQNEQWRRDNRKLPFYYSKAKKQRKRVDRLITENFRVKTYVDVVIKNEENKKRLMDQYRITETDYYDALGEFNARHYEIMYYLTAGELLTLLNNHFASRFRNR